MKLIPQSVWCVVCSDAHSYQAAHLAEAELCRLSTSWILVEGSGFCLFSPGDLPIRDQPMSPAVRCFTTAPPKKPKLSIEGDGKVEGVAQDSLGQRWA